MAEKVSELNDSDLTEFLEVERDFIRNPYELPPDEKVPFRYFDETSLDSIDSSNPEKFQVMVHVKHFKPDELSVKVLDYCVTVHGKHEERTDDHGYITREFTRRFTLPEDVKFYTLTPLLTPDGILRIQACRKPPPGSEREVIPKTLFPSFRYAYMNFPRCLVEKQEEIVEQQLTV